MLDGFAAGARKVRALELVMTNVSVEAVERGAYLTKQIITRELNRDVPGGRLSGAKNRRVSVNYQMSASRSPDAVVRALGPWQLFNNPTSPHLIIARGLGTRNTARAVQGRLGAKLAFGATGRGTFQGSTRAFAGSKRAIAEGRGTAVKQALTIGGSGGKLRAFAFHPGTTGKRTWQRGVEAARGPAVDEMQATVARAVTAAMNT